MSTLAEKARKRADELRAENPAHDVDREVLQADATLLEALAAYLPSEHVQAAARRIAVAESSGEPYGSVAATVAVAHATLELAEQQRIANVIALSQATNADGSRISPWALTHPVNEFDVAVNADIREGLGIS